MKNTYKRLAAYLIDILIVSLIVSCLTSNPITNPTLKKYTKTNKTYQELIDNYRNINIDLKKDYNDKTITPKEKDKLIKKYPEYKNSINKYCKDIKLSKKNYNKLTKDISKQYQKNYKITYHELNKYSKFYNLYYIIVLLLYFLGFNIITKGQTLGKKILKLRIVNNKDEKDVSILNYLIRCILLYNPIYYLLMIIVSFITNTNTVYNFALIFSNIKDYLELIIMVMIVARPDGRGLHDILASTKVINTNNNIININKDYHEENNNNDKELLEENNTDEVQIIRDKSKKKRTTKSKKIIIDEEK